MADFLHGDFLAADFNTGGSGVFAARLIVAVDDLNFDSAGVDQTNTRIIYEIYQGQFKSFRPGRSINGVLGFTKDRAYYCQMDPDFILVVSYYPTGQTT